MSEAQEVEALSEKPKRRRLSHEEAIAKRREEIALLEARQRSAVLDLIEDAANALVTANMKATAAGMETESRMILDAIKALSPKA